MLIVVMMGNWSDDNACRVVRDVQLYTVVISAEEVCCSVVFATLIGVFVISVMWSKLLMTFTISYPLWSSVYTSAREWIVRLHLR